MKWKKPQQQKTFDQLNELCCDVMCGCIEGEGERENTTFLYQEREREQDFMKEGRHLKVTNDRRVWSGKFHLSFIKN
jgi:hypothetical protein